MEETGAALITGANRGIGRAVAQLLAECGWEVCIVGRSVHDGEALRRALSRMTGNPRVLFAQADLASLPSIRAMCERVLRNLPRLRLVINAATVIPHRRLLTRSGLELQFAVNHLAPFALTNFLAARLRENHSSRVITLSSNAHFRADPAIHDAAWGRCYLPTVAYERSKLFNVLFSYELARRLEPDGVAVHCMSPGATNTPLWRLYRTEARGRATALRSLLRRVPLLRGLLEPAITPSEAARSVVALATDSRFGGMTGCYFRRERIARSARVTYDPDLARQLWTLSEQLVGAGWPIVQYRGEPDDRAAA